MGVCEGSLPRLTAQTLRRSARHAPSLRAPLPAASPAFICRKENATQRGPVYGVHVLVCVCVCVSHFDWAVITSRAFLSLVPTPQIQSPGELLEEAPLAVLRCGTSVTPARVSGANEPGSEPPCSGCEGPAESAGRKVQWKADWVFWRGEAHRGETAPPTDQEDQVAAKQAVII